MTYHHASDDTEENRPLNEYQRVNWTEVFRSRSPPSTKQILDRDLEPKEVEALIKAEPWQFSTVGAIQEELMLRHGRDEYMDLYREAMELYQIEALEDIVFLGFCIDIDGERYKQLHGDQ